MGWVLDMPQEKQISNGNGPKRDAKGRLLPGFANLNPGGRPKGLAKTVREMCPEDQIIGRLVKIWSGELKGFSGREQIEAGKILLDRGYGRVVETQVQVQAHITDPDTANALASDATAELLDLVDDGANLIDVTPSVVVLEAGAQVGTDTLSDSQPSDIVEEI